MNLTSILTTVSVLVLLLGFLWLLIPSATQSANTDSQGNELIDPNDSRQLGTLFGMYGLDVVDTAVAKFAVERFKAKYGRPPTTLDIGILVGIIREME